MVKPAGGGNSIGISSKSVVYNFLALKKQITYLNETLGPSTLIIEKYLSGQEFTLGILGNEIKYVLPIIGFPWDFGVRDANLKKVENKLRHKFEIINEYDQRFKKLLEIGINTFDAVLANDIIRIDIKEDADGNPYVIDVNGTPSLATSGSLSYMAQQAKISHSDLINLTLYETLTRYGLKPNMFLEEHILELQSKLTQFNSIEVA
jgi:D-alanine-D-alanine ligase